MRKRTCLLTMAALPFTVLLGCQTTPDRLPANRYSSAEQERAMTQEMNLHQPGKTGPNSASAEDNAALRESMADRSIRSEMSQAAVGTTNEMPGGKALPRPSSDVATH